MLTKVGQEPAMDTIVNLYEAKTHLWELVERAARGEEIVIAKAGRPLARLVSGAPARFVCWTDRYGPELRRAATG